MEVGVSHGERRKDISKVKPKSIWIPAFAGMTERG